MQGRAWARTPASRARRRGHLPLLRRRRRRQRLLLLLLVVEGGNDRADAMGSAGPAVAGAAQQVLRAQSLLEEGLEEGSSLLERDLAMQAVPLGLRPGDEGEGSWFRSRRQAPDLRPCIGSRHNTCRQGCWFLWQECVP
jgi:hypothetical protein